VATSDHALFTSIPGIGRRTAERVVVDLKDKVGAMEIAAVPADGAGGDDHAAARDALVGLGMSVAEAEAALREVDEDAPIEERVRLALSSSLTGAA
jgi:Holliday junction DNA helicase RuvA